MGQLPHHPGNTVLQTEQGKDILIWGTGRLTDYLADTDWDEYRCGFHKGSGEYLLSPKAPVRSSNSLIYLPVLS